MTRQTTERTTVRLPPELLRRAKRKAAAEGRTLTSLIEDGLWLVVAEPQMILADVNVLIYAFRRDVPENALCRPWLDNVILSDTRFGVSPLALSALVRITTNPRAYRIPSSHDDAFGFCEDLLTQPHCQIVEPGRRHWDIFKRLCVETDTRGPRVTDAWFAALAIEWGCEWITLDRDYARFPGLKWQVPAATGR
jgi:toxin-antitoxin system PIN domain toxin